MSQAKFKKWERLKSTKKIQSLFVSGESLFKFPIKLAYFKETQEVEGLREVKAGFSVPKKRIKKAVDRNTIKRRMREVYRLNKNLLWEEVKLGNQNVSLMWIYVADGELEFGIIEKTMKELLNRLVKDVISARSKL